MDPSSRAHTLSVLARLITSREAEEIRHPLPASTWHTLSQEAYAEGVAPLVYQVVRSAPERFGVPAEVLRALQATAYRTAGVNALLNREMARIVEATCRLTPPLHLVALKGIVLIPQLYGNAALRPLPRPGLSRAPRGGVTDQQRAPRARIRPSPPVG
ncbi:MAG: nucleotidyltransferase family protein [Ardenticatenia bacterium]|nr:nucleotidyltransferase family protein [Ardenticatenia bacterium]